MKMFRRILSFFLIFAMLMSMNISSFAAETNAPEDSENAFDSEAHDAQMTRKDVMLLSASNSQTIENEYIQFCVKDVNDSVNSGRFTVGNTGGNPNYSSDDDKILLYGHPNPWSSYTTIRINSTNYIFKADETTYDPSELKAVSTMTAENVLITQTLQIVTNDGTGLKDTVQISYTATNQSSVAKNIAIRIMLDTMLGYNDGAPFKVPSLGNVTKEKELSGNAIPSYWQAFDSLTDASVFAVGTLYKGTDRKPDKVQFTGWQNIYHSENVWDYTINPDDYVTGDSAVAIYWNPTNVAAGSTTNVTTYYGVGYANSGSSSSEGSSEVPSDGFGVQIMDESGNPVTGASVEATNIPGSPIVVTGSDGIASFESLPEGDGSARKVQLNVTKEGYLDLTGIERVVNSGGLTAVTLYLNDGKAHISSAIGQIDDVTVDLVSGYKYFKANSSDVEEADDKSNVKYFNINVTTVGGASISRYQLLQGDSIVAESDFSTISIPVLTGTPTNPRSFGVDWRITKLKAGQVVYLRVVDVNGEISDRKPLGIKISEPTLYGAGDTKGTLEFGDKLKIKVPSDIPILGDTEIELGWNGLPFIFEVSESGKVKFAINPKDDPYSKGSVDGTDLSNWDEVEKEFDDAMEQVALGRSSAAKAFGGTPQKFGAGELSVDANFMGYGEGYIDDNGNIIVDVGLVVTISEEGSYTWTSFLGYIPVYIAVGEKFTLTGKGEIGVTCTDGTWKVSGAVGEINPIPIPKITLNVDGGVGANRVLSIGASGRATLSWLNRWTDNYNRVDLTGEAYIVAKAFLFKAEKKLASGTWTIYDSYGVRSVNALPRALDYDFYDSSLYVPIDRSYNDAPMLLGLTRDTVKSSVYPDASPKLVKVGDTSYLFWLDDIESREDNDRTALVYSISQDCKIWSEPEQVIPETGDSTADFSYDVCVDGNDIHIAICKANKQFGNSAITLDEVASSADVYYVRLDTTTKKAVASKSITSDNYADTMPSIVANAGQVMVAYVQNQLEDGLFGINNSYRVCYQIIDGETKSISVDGLITEMDAGVLGGQTTIGYVVDTDKNFGTDSDTELWVANASEGSPNNKAKGGIHSPTFSNVGLFWYSAGNISYIDSFSGSTSDIFDTDRPADLSHSFYVIEGNDKTKVIWEAMSEDEHRYETVVHAVDYDGNTWSDDYVLFETESELSSVLSGYSNGSNDFITYLKTVGIYSDTQYTSLCVADVTPTKDIAILDTEFVMNDVKPGESLPVSLTIQNCGSENVDSISVDFDGETMATISDADLERGSTKTYQIELTVPNSLSGPTNYLLEISTDSDSNLDNNSVELTIGYTDVGVTAAPLLMNGKDWASITVYNNSNITTGVTVRVIADEKDGAVLYEQNFANLSKSASRAILLDLDSLSGGADVHVFYVTVTADNGEVATANNEDLIYLALGRTATYSLTVSASTGGTIVGSSGGLYSEGDIVTISALADDGYEFVKWTSSNGGSFINAYAESTTFVMPASDVVVTATFRRAESGNPGGSDPGTTYPTPRPTTTPTPTPTPVSPSTYSANIIPSEYGTVEAKPSSALAGETVTLTVKPDDGYVLDALTITDRNGKAVEFKDNGDGTYSFIMPQDGATVKAVFKLEPCDGGDGCPSHDYTDIDHGAWYHDGVDYVILNKLMVGKAEGVFAPNDITTRAEMVTILYHLEGEPTVTMDVTFDDVPAGKWYSDAINWAAANEIVSGYGNGKFGPADTITREQMAVILYNYACYKGDVETNLANLDAYTDAGDVSSWATTAMKWAVAEGIIAGTSTTTLSPAGDSTRAQVATIIMHYCMRSET